MLPQLGWRFPEGKPEQHWRNFTVRALRPGARDDRRRLLPPRRHRARFGVGEPRAAGDPVGYAGPRTHWEPDPAAAWALLAADETGLPALLAILETLPAGLPVFAFAEVEDEDERQAVASAADVDLRWISRERRPPGTTTVLIEAVRALRCRPAGRRCGAAARRSPCATCAATSRPSAPRRDR